MRFKTRAGEQAQVDFGNFIYEDEHATIMVLSYSRVLYVEFVERQDLSTLLRVMVRAFEALGGIPETVLFDNLKAVVSGRGSKGQPEWNRRFLDFALAMGFQPKACRPYRAQTKGRVDELSATFATIFWPGCTFTNLEDLNHQVRAWVDGVANRRLHGTTRRRPVDMLVKETSLSLPNPSGLAGSPAGRAQAESRWLW